MPFEKLYLSIFGKHFVEDSDGDKHTFETKHLELLDEFLKHEGINLFDKIMIEKLKTYFNYSIELSDEV